MKESTPTDPQTQVEKLYLHQKQARAFESVKKVTLCCSGIQGGKSTVGALWALAHCFRYGEGDCAIIGAPTYKILNQSTLPTWLKYAGRYGQHNKGDQEFVFNHGFKVYIRTSSDPESIEGIQNCRWFWMDEAGKCKRQFWINAEGRCARTNAPLFLTTTPYGMNWPFEDIIRPTKEGIRDDVGYFEWTSIDNPSFSREDYERQRLLMDPRQFRMKYMGIHERMQGLVYELSDANYCNAFKLDRGSRFFAGVDWGFAEGHEFAIVIRAIQPNGQRYDIDEFKGSGLDPQQQIDLCKAKASIYGIEMFYCDPARPDLIALLNKAGVSAMGFHIGKENLKKVSAGINEHYRLIKSGDYQVFRDKCPDLIDEYETYHWPEWDQEKKPKENPVAINDHLLDAVRYVTVGTMNIQTKKLPVILRNQVQPHRDFFDPAKKSKKKLSWDAY